MLALWVQTCVLTKSTLPELRRSTSTPHIRNVALGDSGDLSPRYPSLRRRHHDRFVILDILPYVLAVMFLAGRVSILYYPSSFCLRATVKPERRVYQ
ncbi:hypothetical protein SNOG_01117 [Parastagonospora nodorum SN15]|uniref:Uncharacterized protein n=1 Tax=Phaeosphaeria nodorum (strain SN15 / ATCC MYA-4574 / FGSC 10173) TaxID=321614 RepID=Q0V4E7_PHANO|nr:hypothetical protein SNOG_01117 [Parastagonospora nodorum SN15]EAT92612.1 hypothetical protein SNOG_01117 [Parastagonospora nodorum SN15]